MEMAASAAQPCPCPCSSSSFIFFTKRHQKAHLHNLIHFPFRPFPPSHLQRRFSSTAVRDRRRRKWDSNAETIRAKDFSFSTRKNGDEEEEEEDDEDDYEETASSGILEEAIDSIWIFKVFKSYGWTLPPILLSLFFANGPKAFLMTLALPLGQSVITFAFEKILEMSQGKQKKRKVRVRKPRRPKPRRTARNVKREEEVHGGQAPKNRRRMKGYQSWVVDDDSLSEGDRGTSSFGGWDELDGIGSTTKMPSAVENGPKHSTKDGIGSTMKMPSAVENGPTQSTKANDKLSMKQKTSDEPLLLRLLVAVFPFLGSWTKLFW